MLHKGRQEIFTAETTFTAENIPAIVNDAMKIHLSNSADCEYLLNYYRGIQPILQREKLVREDITHNTVINFANSIVRDKVGYFLSSSLQYTLRSIGKQADFEIFNDIVTEQEKTSKDHDVAMDASICGRSFMMAISESDNSPIEYVSLDPRYACVIREAKYTHKPMIGFTYYIERIDNRTYTVYDVRTAGERFVYRTEGHGDIHVGDLISHATIGLPVIPIIEYRNNKFMLSDIEIVMDILNGINLMSSNSLEDIDQFVQSYLVFLNATIDHEVAEKIKKDKMIQLVSPNGATQPADAKFISAQLNPESIKSVKEMFMRYLFLISAIPERMESISGSQTGMGIMLGFGYPAQENDAKGKDMPWYQAEREMIKLTLAILHKRGMCRTLESKDIQPKINRVLYETAQSNAQALTAYQDTNLYSNEDLMRIFPISTDTEQAIANGKKEKGEDWGVSIRQARKESAPATQPEEDTQPLR